MTPAQSFGRYMRQANTDSWAVRGAQELGFDLYDRLRCTGETNDLPAPADAMQTLRHLQTWTRERWPVWYGKRGPDDDGRPGQGHTGQQIISYIWSDFLAWKDAQR